MNQKRVYQVKRTKSHAESLIRLGCGVRFRHTVCGRKDTVRKLQSHCGKKRFPQEGKWRWPSLKPGTREQSTGTECTEITYNYHSTLLSAVFFLGCEVLRFPLTWRWTNTGETHTHRCTCTQARASQLLSHSTSKWPASNLGTGSFSNVLLSGLLYTLKNGRLQKVSVYAACISISKIKTEKVSR